MKPSFRTHAVLPLLALTLACLPELSLAGGDSPRPNIVYILADDMGYCDPGFNGGKEIQTPQLNQLAESGTILKSFYVQPVCSPTRSTLMTGRFVSHTGVYQVVRPHAKWGLPLGERTLASALRDAGYETAICGKWHLGEFQADYRPMHRGFDHQYGLWFGAIDYFTHQRDGVIDWHRDDQSCEDEGYSTHLIAKEACQRIRAKAADKPLFLYVPFNAVHAPHQVPESYTEPYQSLTGVRRTYAGMVAAMDEGVGQIVAALKDKGILDNTLIVFSSDNGGPEPGKVTSNYPLRAGKATIYEGGVRVCAFATWPGHVPAGRSVNEPLHIADWYPTLIKLAGGNLDQKLPLDGRDIWQVVSADAKSPHDALLLPGMAPGQAALRMGKWKLVVKRGARRPMAAPAELYDLESDVGEKHNLVAEQPAIAGQMREKMKELLSDAVPHGNPDAAMEAAGKWTPAQPDQPQGK